jgi:hypothetical protein
MWMSLASAAFAELPLAFLAFAGARRLLKATVEASLEGPAVEGERARELVGRGAGPSLRQTPLSGTGLDEALPRPRDDQAERVGKPGASSRLKAGRAE